MTNESGLIPVEYQVVIALDAREEKTAGGIILTKQTQEADRLSTQEGTLVAVSPLAFNYDNWPLDAPKPKVGDRVLFRRYNGFIHTKKVGGVEYDYRMTSDRDVLAIIEPANALRAVA